MRFVYLSLAVLSSFVFATPPPMGSPQCYSIGTTLYGEDLDTLDANCLHYVGDGACDCPGVPTSYADGQAVVNGRASFYVNPAYVPYSVNLYSGNLMVFPTDKCCPPPTFLHQTLECPHYDPVEDLGECCFTETHTYVANLPPMADCVHDLPSYNGAHAVAGGVTTFMGASSGIEVYASDKMGNSCGDFFLYSLTCSECDL